MGFPTSYRWSAYVTPNPPQRVAERAIFQLFGIKFNFNRTKVCYKLLFYENFQQQSCRAVNQLWHNGKI